MSEQGYSRDATFPVDWDEWRAQWHAWRDAMGDRLGPTSYCFPPKNFLADAVLGVYGIHGRGAVELSEVTFPDLERPRSYTIRRYVGVTWGTAGTIHLAGPLVDTFAALESELFGD